MDILQLPGVQRANGAVYNWDMTEVELKTFGERVTWLLRRRRMANQDIASQKELAAKIGMKPQQLNAYMNGRRTPNVRHLRAMAAALETSVSFLALATTDSAPDAAADASIEPVAYLSDEADEAAQLIDAMRDPKLRDIALDLVRVLAMYDSTADEDSPAKGAGGAGGRLIFGKLLGNIKKATRANPAEQRELVE